MKPPPYASRRTWRTAGRWGSDLPTAWPIILMSRNRKEEKDRHRSQHDYRVNLKAELGIRHLNEKMDHMLARQWERLAEIQEIQVELRADLSHASTA
jgi:uncharacterized membrane protein